MASKPDFTTVAISPRMKQVARLLAAATGESLKGFLERLIKEENDRMKAQASTDKTPGDD